MEHKDDEKWKIFTEALEKVQRQVHPNLGVSIEALHYIEKLMVELLQTMCQAKPSTIQDVIEQVQKTFPKPIDRWAIQDADSALNRYKNRHKKGDKMVLLPVEKVQPLLKESLGYRLDFNVTLYMTAVLEYVAADILKLVGNYVRKIQAKEIKEEDVKISMCADKVLNNMFFSNGSNNGPDTFLTSSLRVPPQLSSSYEELVKDLIQSEQQHLRELELIIKVFRVPFVDLFPQSKDIEVIFSNILDVHSFSLHLLSTLEDTVEITEQNQIPLIGTCFDEMIEGAEFDVYERYMEDVMNPRLYDRLYALLKREDLTNKLQSIDPGFKDVVKYVLPKLLEGPIYHLKYIFQIMDKLKEENIKVSDEDMECFSQVLAQLTMLRSNVERRIAVLSASSGSANNLRRHSPGYYTDLVSGSAKMNDIQKSIENWAEEKDINQQCVEFIFEGMLTICDKNRERERHAFLFDSLILLCKPTGQRKAAAGGMDYKLKEKLLIKHVDVRSIEDTEDTKFMFELLYSQEPHLTLRAKSEKEKAEWMSALLYLLFRSNLDRLLDSKQKDDDRNHALILPLVDEYPFSEEDSEENLILEETHTPGEPPLIKGATLNKLIERLTFHKWADPKFVRRFLTVYRSFCSPKELLDLLIKRYQIPENMEIYSDNREAFSRFKKEYVKPVQFRVLNVIRHWAEHHFYDFEREEKLLSELNKFLEAIKSKIMRKWVDSIVNILKRKVESSNILQGISQDAVSITSKLSAVQFSDEAPPVEWHTVQEEKDKFDIMTLHPVEIARQETLIEFTLFKAVMPSELVGSVFTKKDKATQSPNLMRLIQQTNRFTYWLEESILTTKNIEERVAVVCRIIEIMIVFKRINNFNGVLCVVSALDSAPIHRLSATFELMKATYKKHLEEAKELLANNFKKYFDKLRAIDPPCVPFFGVYMTNILKLEEGNPDCLPNTDLINFSKRRKVADITAEIQQYQNQPYNLKPVPIIQEYLKELNPCDGLTESGLDEELYEKSLEIEPRSKPLPKFGRKYDSSALKSPGIKPKQASVFKAHIPFSVGHDRESKFTFPKSSTTDDDDTTSGTSVSSPPTTPNTPITPPPRTPPPRTPPYGKNTPPRTPQLGSRSPLTKEDCGESQLSLYSSSSTVCDSVPSLYSQFTSTSTLCNQVFDSDEQDEQVEHYELAPPPLPPRRATLTSHQDLSAVSQLSLSEDTTDQTGVCIYGNKDIIDNRFLRDNRFLSSSRDVPPKLPPKLPNRLSSSNVMDMADYPPRLPPRVSRSKPIERSGSMHGPSDNRYSVRRNSGDHVNMNGIAPGTPQLPPRTYRPPSHGRQRSQ